MSKRLQIFLAVSLGWAALVGLGLFLGRVPLDSIAGIVIMAVVYMPSPLVAALLAERGIRRDRFRLPRGGAGRVFAFLLLPALAVYAFVLLFLVVVFVGGNLLGLPVFGVLATTPDGLVAGAASLLGQAAVDAAGPPPPVPVLLIASMWGALVAGWTINGLFAMGEEYGWRGLMWDELKSFGTVRANLLIGVAWGLWHAPVILQGYNYPGSPLLGVLAMVLFCTGMSFVLTAIRERTGSLLPVAAAHGVFNALAPILLMLAPGVDPVLTGPLGLVGAVLLLGIGALLCRGLRRRTAALPAAEAANELASR
jgi:uncharacterized protein